MLAYPPGWRAGYFRHNGTCPILCDLEGSVVITVTLPHLKRGLSRTGRRIVTDAVHAKVYTNFQKRVKGFTLPILADTFFNLSVYHLPIHHFSADSIG